MSDPHAKLLNQLAVVERQRDDAEARTRLANVRCDHFERELAEARAEVERLTALLSEWATRCGAAETEARELREGRATWVDAGGGKLRLVRRVVMDEDLGEVGPGTDPARVTYAYATGRASGTGVHYDPTREQSHLRAHAQRIVEMLTGVKP